VELDDEHDTPAEESEMTYEDRELSSRVFSQLVLVLPPRERAAVILREVLGYSLAEVAAILETSVGGVKAALHRGRAKLTAAKDTAVLAGTPAPPAAVARYIEAFNRRDWTALLALLEDEVRLEVVDRALHVGRSAVAGNYLGNYSKMPPGWRLVLGEVDGEPMLVFIRERDSVWTPHHVIRLDWRADQVARIRDYTHVPYMLADAHVTFDPT
jgi:RNA polymerase sigma-70 factor (ECF subfamily)